MPGIYYIQIEAQNANSVPTGTQIDMIVTVTDPCDQPNSITILSGLVSPNPIAYKIFDPQIDLTLKPQTDITVSEASKIVDCPPI